MRKGIWVVILLFTQLTFAFKDSDLDGVEDSVDRCPNTPILELVDETGCPLERKRWVRGKFYIRIGGGYIKDRAEERAYSSLSLAYSYKGLYTSFTTRYYLSSKVSDPGMGDSSLFLGYSRFLTESLYVLPGVRIKVPTGDKQFSDGKVDYTPSLVLDYLFGKADLFTYLSYTFRGDKRLKDTITASFGGGYDLTSKLYLSLSYDVSESAVRDSYNSYASLFAIYDISRRLYITLSYSKGLNSSATDHSLSGRLGIRF